MNTPLETLVAAASLAPSGDNTQPWRFELDEETRRIAIFVDEQRDTSPMNVGQSMARIAVGAAIENLLHTAKHNEWEVRSESGMDRAVAMLHVGKTGESAGKIAPVLSERTSNRRIYDRTSFGQDLFQRLTSAVPEVEGLRVVWICDRIKLSQMASLIGIADATMFGMREMRNAFLANVRFDVPPDAFVTEGLSLSSLEISGLQAKAFQWTCSMRDGLLRWSGALRTFASHAKALVTSASGLCVVVAPDHLPQTDVLVGRAMQRAWLALTEQGCQVQPMMSLPVLENAVKHGAKEILRAKTINQISAIGGQFRALLPGTITDTERPAAILRFGSAASPSGRVGRRPWTDMVRFCTLTGSVATNDPEETGT